MVFAVDDDLRQTEDQLVFPERTSPLREELQWEKTKPMLFCTAASDLAGETEKADHEMEVLAFCSFQLAGCQGQENTD